MTQHRGTLLRGAQAITPILSRFAVSGNPGAIHLGVTCSMSRSENVWDNSEMESFFSSLKTERTARKVYRTRKAARADAFDYIERFYNPTRRHSTLEYVSPIRYEAQAQVA